jgi:hypothetical protein
MNVSITATSAGLTEQQRMQFVDLCFALDEPIDELHHGDCIGGDDELDDLAARQGLCRMIVMHPASGSAAHKRAHANLRNWPYPRELRDPAPPIERDHIMVDSTELTIALPRSMQEERRSGTWATIRYAKRTGAHLAIIYPDGKEEWHNGKEIVP